MKLFRSVMLSILMVAIVFSFSFVAPVAMDFEAEAATGSGYYLGKKTITVYVGETYTQKLYNSSDKAVTASKITWKSGDKKIATISEKGKITPVKAGETTMTAKYKGKTYKFTVKVKSSALKLNKSKITFDKDTTTARIKISASSKYREDGFYYKIASGNNNVNVYWDKNWKNGAIYLNIECKNPGDAKITVYPTAYPKKTRTITVTYDRGYKNCYEAGNYKVGTDIPAGEYVVFSNSTGLGGLSGYMCISSDANKNNIIENENFEYNTIISVRSGDYLELSRCHAVPIAEAKLDINATGGTYKVGYHIEAGDYRLTNNSSTSAYYAILSGPLGGDRKSGILNHIISNDNFDGSRAYVTLENGQYITLTSCYGNFVKPEKPMELEATLDYSTSLPSGTTFDVTVPSAPFDVYDNSGLYYTDATVNEIEVQKLYDKKSKTYAVQCNVYGSLKSNWPIGSITLKLVDEGGNEVGSWSDFFMSNGYSGSMSIDAELRVEKLPEGKYTLLVDITA